MEKLKLLILIGLLRKVQAQIVANATLCAEGNKYLNLMTMQCADCPQNMIPNADGKSCDCNPRSAYGENVYRVVNLGCTACPAGEAPTPDKAKCLPCGGVVGSDGACTCPNVQETLNYLNADGTYATSMTCESCVDGSYPVDNVCQRLAEGNIFGPTGEISCDIGFTSYGGQCYLNAQVSTISTFILVNAERVTFNFLPNNQGIFEVNPSAVMRLKFEQSAIKCSLYKDPQSCQIIANLCVLNLYREDQTLCNLYDTLMNANPEEFAQYDQGWKTNFPWILYRNNPTDVLRNEKIVTSFTLSKLDSDISELPLYVAKYNFTGELISFTPLTNELTLCPFSTKDVQDLKKFGNRYKSSCNIDMERLFYSEKDQFFYEIFIKSTRNEEYTEIPILITNYLKSGNSRSNQDLRNLDEFTLVRRYVKYDVTTGIQGLTQEEFDNNVPLAVRFIRNAAVYVDIVETDDQRIYKPYVILTYGEKKLENINSLDGTSSTLEMRYFSDFSVVWSRGALFFYLLHIPIAIIIIVQMYIWTMYNPQVLLGAEWCQIFIFNFISKAISTWSFAVFYYLTFFTGYIFIFFKFQTKIFIFFPDLEDEPELYRKYRIIYWMSIVGMIYHLLYLVYEQSSIDVFFIDWEKQRRTESNSRPVDKENEQEGNLAAQSFNGSAWRLILIANEFNELFGLRYISVELGFIIFTVLMKGYKWENYAANNTYMTTDIGTLELNYVLKFFLSTITLLVIGSILYVNKISAVRLLTVIKFPTPLQNFTDLCSVANISMFVFDSYCHGYYIHGLNPVGSSEGTIEDLKTAFKREELGNCRGRGLISSDTTGLQTYEIFFPKDIREKYRDVSETINFSGKLSEQILKNPSMQMGLSTQRMKPSLPENMDYTLLDRGRSRVSNYLKRVIESVVSDATNHILEKTPLFRLLRIPPENLETFKGCPIFYKDPEMGFQQYMSFGSDFNIYVANIAVYQLFDIWTRNTFVSLFLSYLFHLMYKYLKSWRQKVNFSRRTMIDEMFLI